MDSPQLDGSVIGGSGDVPPIRREAAVGDIPTEGEGLVIAAL